MPQIYFNGQTYNDLAEMPARERQMHEQLMSALSDEDGDGLPDILEGDVVGKIIEMAKKSGTEDSKQLAALEKISPEMRARISKGVARLNELGLLSGMQNLVQEAGASPAGAIPTWEDAEIRPSKPVIPAQPAIQDDSSPRRVLVFGMLIAVLVFLAGIAFLVVTRAGF